MTIRIEKFRNEIDRLKKEFNEFIHENTISEGANGLVLLGHHKKLNTKVAIKIYDHDPDQSNQEPELLCKLDHPHIIKVYDARLMSNDTSFYMMPQANNGSLIDYLKTNTIDTNQSFQLAFDLLDALSYLHSDAIGLVHRDLKPENIFMNGNSLLIGDFGSVRRLDITSGKAPASKHSILFRPPEAFGINPFFDKTSDLYQAGLIAFILFGFQYSSCLLNYLSEKEIKFYKAKTATPYKSAELSNFIDNCIENRIVNQKLFDTSRLPWYLTRKTRHVLKKSVQLHGKRYSSTSEFISELQNAKKNAPNWLNIPDGYMLKSWKNSDYKINCSKTEYVLSKKRANGDYRIIDKLALNKVSDFYNHYQPILKLP